MLEKICCATSDQLKSENPGLHADAEALYTQCQGKSPEEVNAILKANGAIIKMITDWIKAHPGQIMAWMQFFLAMFGGSLPVPTPTPTVG